MSKAPALKLQGICKSFHQGHKALHVLKGIDLEVKQGELVALIGASGSGKSTLLQVAGLLDRPTSGTIAIAGAEVHDLKDEARSDIRRNRLGFVYQFHHLLPDFTALENVELALRISGVSSVDATAQAKAVLEEIGLAERLNHTPSELSGGEQQRVAIARAIVTNPSLLLADEPTGNLDEETAARVFKLLVSMVRDRGLAAVIATHDASLAAQMDRQLHLSAGVLHES
ncbi:ABC transporter ATP-binding protein [Kordiimonas lipolytica]|uniref:ABC transporter ATP-binding protein n=1 Tax=Kordiimonas lipolytica TaxID=1662421 RepID=A0ABV8U8Y7_9PROT|nr:ABC transporter ATP-binding protein [Kordiimonas lipolytica]